MGFCFSEEEIKSMYGMYQNVLNDIQESTNNIVKEIGDISKELKYLPVINLSKEAVTYYNEGLKESEVSLLERWKEGELSFSKFMERFHAGEKAKERSNRLEGEIEEQIKSWKSIDLSELDSIDCTYSRCHLEDFENIQKEIENYINKLNEMEEHYSSEIEKQKEENDIYISIEPVILQSIAIVEEGFREGISKSYDKLKQDFANKEREQKTLGNGVKQDISSKAKNLISSGLSAFKSKTNGLLD